MPDTLSLMAASSLPLRLRPPPLPLNSVLQASLDSSFILFRFRRNFKPYRVSASSSSNPSTSSSWDREEIRWLREEQRWLREEQRWIREESRWNSEREALLREIAALKLRIEALELQKTSERASVSDLVANLASLLQALKGADFKPVTNQIAETGSGPVPMMLEEAEMKGMVVKESRVDKSDRKEEVRVPDSDGKEKLKKRASLRVGSEGEDVRVMQEALQRLGFYSGEEDMEYSSFSSGTERAVKTWQATLGASEDGVMTAELLERLFMELEIVNTGSIFNRDQKGDSIPTAEKDGENGAAVASVTEIAEIRQTVVKESGTDAEVSQHRVFLLGENRWEEPSRLVGREKQIIGSNRGAVIKCLTCRGEGNLMCTECDGTGEPNIEPQFMEWVEEGTKCPYCEGLGYTSCDVCDGKGMVAA